ncbi:MAG: VCBS repeat-containing protein [Flavobacteriales bacterium]|nr:VCBS repeat-containing protein [Flavobacteriales bacterium]
MREIILVLIALSFFACGPKKSKETEQKKKDASLSLFTLLNPDSTGLDYFNQLDETEELNILTYEYLYNGGGVAVGDINNDNLPDVFLVGNTYGGRLYLNQGNLKFKQISESAGVFVPGFSTGVSMVDINEDGYLDIYLCRSLVENPEQRRNVLLINNGDLTFTDRAAEYGLDDPSFSNYANFFNYDRDGDLDLYLLNHRTDFKEALTIKTYTDANGISHQVQDTAFQYVSDQLYRNNGNGTFTNVTKAAGIENRAFGLSVTIADINQDSWPDIYVANDYADKDHFYLNQGDGTFKDQIEDLFSHTSKNAMGSDIADFNNDGFLDLINLDMVAEDNYRQKQLKGSGSYDLYQMAVRFGMTHQVMRNTLQLNNGNGTFSEIGQLAGVSHTDWSWSPLFADLDNDGWKDLFITNGYYRDVTDMDYLKYESNEVLLDEGGVPNTSPLALTQRIPKNPVSNYVFQNNGDLTFSDQSQAWGMNHKAISNGAVYADLDLDGDLDLICNNLNSKAFLFENNAEKITGNNFIQIRLKGAKGNAYGVGAKVTVITTAGIQFQEASPYRGYFSSQNPVLHFGLGKEEQIESIEVIWPNSTQQTLKDVAVNQQLEINIKNATPSLQLEQLKPSVLLSKLASKLLPQSVHKEDDFIDFKQEALLEHMLSNKGPFLAQGDVNGDGLEDVYLSASAGYEGELYLQNQKGEFNKKQLSSFTKDALFEDGQALFFDADQDQDLDLYVVSGGSAFAEKDKRYQDRLYLNDGKGNFERSNSALPSLKENGTCIVPIDVDMDGDLDLFVGAGVLPGSYPLCSQSLLLINSNGQFEVANHLLPNNGKLGMINAVKVIDLTKNGTPDLLLAGEWMPITQLLNTAEGFQKKEIPNSSGWWNCLEIADIDQDGDLDFVAGNRGENNFYKVSSERPASIYAKDFDDNGSIDALPFYYFNDGKAHPKHTLDEVSSQYPAIRRKFSRYKKYSSAVLKDLFSSEQLKGSVQLSAQNFSSCYFKNMGDGNFQQMPLPKVAQFSEVHGLLIQDLNSDGHLDVLLSGNQYGADVEAGRHDAGIGCALLGDGKGNFTALASTKSGFKVIGDSRGLYSIQQNGKSVIWVLRNNESIVGFSIALSEE